MQVYLETEQDWIDFVNGQHVVAHRNDIMDYYKKINVAENEIVLLESDVVTIVKKY